MLRNSAYPIWEYDDNPEAAPNPAAIPGAQLEKDIEVGQILVVDGAIRDEGSVYGTQR